MTLSYGEWRAMARRNPEALKAAGFKDDRRKRDEDRLRLELELAPGWAPGRGYESGPAQEVSTPYFLCCSGKSRSYRFKSDGTSFGTI